MAITSPGAGIITCVFVYRYSIITCVFVCRCCIITCVFAYRCLLSCVFSHIGAVLSRVFLPIGAVLSLVFSPIGAVLSLFFHVQADLVVLHFPVLSGFYRLKVCGSPALRSPLLLFSSSVCSHSVSVSHFGNSHNISNFIYFIIKFVMVICGW